MQAKARADRWTEEVILLLEEMRRTLAYCNWKQEWWLKRVASRSGPVHLEDGTSAYARKQADVWSKLGKSFADQWAPIIQKHNLPSDWPPSFADYNLGNCGDIHARERNWVLRVQHALGTDPINMSKDSSLISDAESSVSSQSDS